LLARPAYSAKEFVGPIHIPVGKEECCIGCHGVKDLGAEDTVLTILGFEITVGTKRVDRDAAGQGTAQVAMVPPPAGIQDRDLNLLTSISSGMPAVDTQSVQMLGTEVGMGGHEGGGGKQ
jgi:hypothetical protein